MLCLYLFIMYFVCHVESLGSSLPIEEGIQEYIKTGNRPAYLPHAIEDFFKTQNKADENKQYCKACNVVVSAAINLRRESSNKDKFKNFTQDMCLWFTTFGSTVCSGYIETEIDTALYIIDNRKDLTADRVCAIKLQERNCEDANTKPWSINVSPGTPRQTEEKSTVDSKKIVHFTDFHYDPLYEPGSAAVCDEPLCCANNSGKPKKTEYAAGYWGDYHVCDTPFHSIEELLMHVKKEHRRIDWIYFTGDLVSHRFWTSTKEINSNSIKRVMKKLRDAFGTIPVYPVLGNHEAHPTDFYSDNIADPTVSNQWIFDLIAEEWMYWLPKTTVDTIKKGGYYTVLVKPGFRIIALNSNVCYVNNRWLIYEDKDPHGQLQWLTETLLEAENNNESVHIISHIPPGSPDCLKQWSHEFRRIVHRFSSTISTQFNGHSHLDELKVFYDLNNPEQVINVAFNGGSLTSFVGLNPNYKIYEVDTYRYKVLDYEQWTYNLDEANNKPKDIPKWYKLYTFKDAYGLEKLDASNFHKFLQNMANNSSMLEQYHRFQVRKSPIELKKPCDKQCLSDIFCSITGVEFEESIQCKAFRKKNYKS